MIRVLLVVSMVVMGVACSPDSGPAPVLAPFVPPVPTPTPVPTSTPTPTPTPVPTPVPFRTAVFEVQAGGGQEFTLDVPAGYMIELRFQSDLDINATLLDPAGVELGRWFRAESLSGIRHSARSGGTYTLQFDNSFSLFTPKRVTVEFRVVPPWGQ